MGSESTRAQHEELRFDRAVDANTDSATNGEAASVVCKACGSTIRREYWHVNGDPACGLCADAARRDGAARPSAIVTLRAALFGLGAAIVGAIIYYAVIAITDFEIGIVAILTGFIVGWALHRGAGGRGSRPLQLLGVALVYLSIALAYTPLAIKGAMESSKSSSTASADSTGAVPSSASVTAAADSVVVAAPESPQVAAAADSTGASQMSFGAAIGGLLVVALMLPVMVIVGSMPSGLISALIIFIGMQQAWKMTAARAVAVSGPYKVGTESSPATG